MIPDWAEWRMKELIGQREAGGEPWMRFFDSASLYLGIYSLQPGENDPQQPHEEDEIYYVESGSAVLRIGSEDVAVRPGSLLYVKAGVPHHFHSIETPLNLLVMFPKTKHV